ncbi:MAG: hypothetical protein NTX52_14570, partial [Planctomycetota bacterium]|nr:hypothetical protein [Planctomycetota bacterium]
MLCSLKKGFIVVLICWAPAQLFGVPKTPTEAEPNRISVSELLDKYAANQDLLRSIIIKSQTSGELYGNATSLEGNPTGKLGKSEEKRETLSEIRTDDNRVASRLTIWFSDDRGLVPKDKPEYLSHLWDGNCWYEYSRGGGRSYASAGDVWINRSKKDDMRRSLILAVTANAFYGDKERVDAVLRRADVASVRDEMEEIGGSKCYVIDVTAQGGKYKTWIDPEHGYNIAKAMIEKREKDIVYGTPLRKGEHASVLLENVRFQKVDGAWIPVEADIYINRVAFNGSFKSRTHRKVTDVVLNPDHDALGSFVPDDIKNGAEVRIVTADGNLHYKEKYTWQD